MCPPVKIAPITGGFLLFNNRVLCNDNTRFHMVPVFVIPDAQRPETIFDSRIKPGAHVGVCFLAEHHINPYAIPFTFIIFSGNNYNNLEPRSQDVTIYAVQLSILLKSFDSAKRLEIAFLNSGVAFRCEELGIYAIMNYSR